MFDHNEIHILNQPQCSHGATPVVERPRRVFGTLEGVIPLIPGIARAYAIFKGEDS